MNVGSVQHLHTVTLPWRHCIFVSTIASGMLHDINHHPWLYLNKDDCSSKERRMRDAEKIYFTREDPLMMSVSCLTSWLVLVMTLLVCCCVECLKEREKSERGENTGNHALQTTEDDSKWFLNYPKVQCSPSWARFTALLDGLGWTN